MHKLDSKCLAPHSPSHKGQQKVKHNGSLNVFHKSNLTFIPTPYPLPLKVQDSQYTLYTHKLHHILLMAKLSMRRYSWDQIFFGRKREVYWIDEHMYRLWTHKYMYMYMHNVMHVCIEFTTCVWNPIILVKHQVTTFLVGYPGNETGKERVY